MRAVGAVILTGLALFQAGCATMNQDQCLAGDWARVGYEDGAGGAPRSRLDDHAKACAAYGVRPDAATYLDARERGLTRYCTPPRGFTEGRLGHKYFDVCPPAVARGFLVGYDDGLRVHSADEYRDEISDDVRRFDRRIDDIENELDDIRDRLDDGTLDASTRRSLEDARRNLRRDLRAERSNRDQARRRESDAAFHADRLRRELSRFYGGG